MMKIFSLIGIAFVVILAVAWIGNDPRIAGWLPAPAATVVDGTTEVVHRTTKFVVGERAPVARGGKSIRAPDGRTITCRGGLTPSTQWKGKPGVGPWRVVCK